MTRTTLAMLGLAFGCARAAAQASEPLGSRPPLCEWDKPRAAGVDIWLSDPEIVFMLGTAPIQRDGNSWSVCYTYGSGPDAISIELAGDEPARIVRIKRGRFASEHHCAQLSKRPTLSNGVEVGVSKQQVTALLGVSGDATDGRWRYECSRSRPLTPEESLSANADVYQPLVTQLVTWRELTVWFGARGVEDIQFIEWESVK